eukprot:12885191-Prorocentrum_lima.AAC.1
MHKFLNYGAAPVAQDTGNVHGTACGTHRSFRGMYDYAPFHFQSGNLPTSVAVAIVVPPLNVRALQTHWYPEGDRLDCAAVVDAPACMVQRLSLIHI